MKDTELIKLLQSRGFEVIRIKGSHHIMKKDNMIEVIPVHNRDVPKGLLLKILKRIDMRGN